MAETINLGIVGIKNCGDYNSQTTYEKLNVVTYQGSSYCAKQNTQGNLPTDTDYWQLYAEKGDQGDKGDKGDQGDKGDKGNTGDPGGKPLVASSVSEMTDTTSVYVNTTNGYWYTYDGTQWVVGGVYQAAEDSTLLTNVNKYTAKMAKGIHGNVIYLTKNSTNLTVTLKNSNNINIVTENGLVVCHPSGAITKTFPLSTYNISSGRWVLYVRNDSFELGKFGEVNLVYNDVILCIFTPNEVISATTDNLIYNNNNLGRNTVFHGYNIPIDSYNSINIEDDIVNKTLTIITDENPPVVILNKAIQQIKENVNTVLSYNISLLNSDIFGVVYNYELDTFRIIQLFRFQDKRGYINKNSYDTCLYGDVLLFAYNKSNHKIFPFLKEFYYNNNLISIDSYQEQINNLHSQFDGVIKYDFLRCFKNFTFIGDSLMAGYTNVNGNTINSATAKAQNNNWPSYLCSRLNRTFTNLANGDSTIHNWRYADQTGQSSTNIENANINTGIYFVGLGVNDLRKSLTVGTSADINASDYTQNVDSVYGNFDYIINRLKSFNPYAKIFVFTIGNNEINDPTDINNAIKYVANLYSNVYVIDLNSLVDFNSGFINDNYTHNHYNPITYNYISLIIENAVNKYIFDNYTNFQLVPYDY